VKKQLLIIFFILLSPSLTCHAGDNKNKGLTIAMEADKRASGYGNFTARMQMVLINKQGRESHRQMRIRVLETEDDGNKSLTIFDSPKDVKGTALLTHSHKQQDDDQWLYLPALKRVKRISSRNKSGSFMGSEFSFEDLASQEVEKYTYRYIGEEILNGQACFIIERYPKDTKNSGYSRIVSWLDKDEYRTVKEDYFDKKKRLVKTLTLENYHLYLRTIWRAHDLQMINHQNGKKTNLLCSEFIFRAGLLEKDFHRNILKRMR
jgi:outer membrane lipoprotein-sorting protein